MAGLNVFFLPRRNINRSTLGFHLSSEAEKPEFIEVPENFLCNKSIFALRVRGNSMLTDGIRDGDILIITQQSHAENGQTVVALVREEATTKNLFQSEKEIELWGNPSTIRNLNSLDHPAACNLIRKEKRPVANFARLMEISDLLLENCRYLESTTGIADAHKQVCRIFLQ